MIGKSELIIREDGAIYHLGLRPNDIAQTIITVGDPDRVDQVTKHFDSIRVTQQIREFKTVTGAKNGKEITVISTGIGTDNIDIVFNELDALVNIDLKTRTVKEQLTSLDFIRLGTSGSLQEDILVDSLLLSEYAIGTDGLMHYYPSLNEIAFDPIDEFYKQQIAWPLAPYFTKADPALFKSFSELISQNGITITAAGFYGPQMRAIRMNNIDRSWIEKAASLKFYDTRVTNLEMETAGIYGMAQILGHRALSINAILANRITRTFSENPGKVVDEMIESIIGSTVDFRYIPKTPTALSKLEGSKSGSANGLSSLFLANSAAVTKSYNVSFMDNRLKV